MLPAGIAVAVVLPMISVAVIEGIAPTRRRLLQASIAAAVVGTAGAALAILVGPAQVLFTGTATPVTIACFAALVAFALALDWRVDQPPPGRRSRSPRTRSRHAGRPSGSSRAPARCCRRSSTRRRWRRRHSPSTARSRSGTARRSGSSAGPPRRSSAGRCRRRWSPRTSARRPPSASGARSAASRRGATASARLTKDGREVWIEIYGAVLRDRDGQPIGIAGQLVDVTERVALEAQLAHAERLEAIGRARGRHRPRLQQHAHGHRRVRVADRRRDRPTPTRSGRMPRPSSTSSTGRASSRASCSRSRGGRRSSRRRRHPDDRAHARADAPPPARRRRRRHPAAGRSAGHARRRGPAGAGRSSTSPSTPATRCPTAGRSSSRPAARASRRGDIADDPYGRRTVRGRLRVRHRQRHDGRRAGSRVRTVLHDQGARPRHRARARDGARLRPPVRRPRPARVGAGRRDHRRAPVPRAGWRAGRRPPPTPIPAPGPEAPSRSWWSTTSPRSRRSPGGRWPTSATRCASSTP